MSKAGRFKNAPKMRGRWKPSNRSDRQKPEGLAVSKNDLFVTIDGNSIGEYTTSGATVNAKMIPGLSGSVVGIAIGPVAERSAGALAGLGTAVLWL